MQQNHKRAVVRAVSHNVQTNSVAFEPEFLECAGV